MIFTAAYLGAVGNVSYTGTLTPYGTAYRLGGGGGTLTMANTNALTDARTLTVNGNVTLAGTNNYSNGTTLSSGTLTLGDAGSLGSGALTINGGTLASTGTLVTTNVVNGNGTTGTGALTMNGSGTLVLSGANDYSGITTVNGAGATLRLAGSNSSAGLTNVTLGTLQLASTSNGGLASGTLSFGNGTLDAAVTACGWTLQDPPPAGSRPAIGRASGLGAAPPADARHSDQPAKVGGIPACPRMLHSLPPPGKSKHQQSARVPDRRPPPSALRPPPSSPC